MAAAKPKPGYKRSWKNLLLNKRYQLRFTFFMVGISAVLMIGLGIWVMKEANEATTVAMARVRGEACPKVPEIVEVPAGVEEPAAPMTIEDAPAVDKPPVDDPTAPAPAKEAPRVEPSKVDPKHVAANNAQTDLLQVQALWCSDAECKPEAATPLQVKVKKCDDYVKAKMENA